MIFSEFFFFSAFHWLTWFNKVKIIETFTDLQNEQCWIYRQRDRYDLIKLSLTILARAERTLFQAVGLMQRWSLRKGGAPLGREREASGGLRERWRRREISLIVQTGYRGAQTGERERRNLEALKWAARSPFIGFEVFNGLFNNCFRPVLNMNPIFSLVPIPTCPTLIYPRAI